MQELNDQQVLDLAEQLISPPYPMDVQLTPDFFNLFTKKEESFVTYQFQSDEEEDENQFKEFPVKKLKSQHSRKDPFPCKFDPELLLNKIRQLEQEKLDNDKDNKKQILSNELQEIEYSSESKQ